MYSSFPAIDPPLPDVHRTLSSSANTRWPTAWPRDLSAAWLFSLTCQLTLEVALSQVTVASSAWKTVVRLVGMSTSEASTRDGWSAQVWRCSRPYAVSMAGLSTGSGWRYVAHPLPPSGDCLRDHFHSALQNSWACAMAFVFTAVGVLHRPADAGELGRRQLDGAVFPVVSGHAPVTVRNPL